jgi:hypothetical protein
MEAYPKTKGKNMEKVSYNSLAMKLLLAVILTLATALAFVLYNLIMNPQTNVYGANAGVNVSVQVSGPASCSPPEIKDINPLTGPGSGGIEATITGDNLNCVDEVLVGESLKCEPITHIDNSELKCIMPPHTEGYVSITVVASGHGESTKDNGFRYIGNSADDTSPPLVPNTGLFRLGGQIVTLYDVLAFIAITVPCLVAALIVWKRSHRRRAGEQA